MSRPNLTATKPRNLSVVTEVRRKRTRSKEGSASIRVGTKRALAARAQGFRRSGRADRIRTKYDRAARQYRNVLRTKDKVAARKLKAEMFLYDKQLAELREARAVFPVAQACFQ